MTIWTRLGAILVALSVPSLAAGADLALVLNGLDNSLSTVQLPGGTPQPGVHGFASYPGHGAIVGNRYVVPVSGADRVVRFDLGGLSPLDTLATGAGSNPFAALGDGGGNLLVSLLAANQVVRYDDSGVETGRAPAGRAPEGMLLSEGRLLVAATGLRFTDFSYDRGRVMVLDPASLATVDSVAVGLNPQWIRETPTEIHVLCTGNYFSVFGEIHVLDRFTLAPVDTIPIGGSPGFLELGGNRGYVSDYFAGVLVYDTVNHTILRGIANPVAPGGSGYSGLALDGAGHLFVTLFDDDLLLRLLVTDFSVSGVFATGDGPGSVTLRTGPVPVRLAYFRANPTAEGVTLSWSMDEDDGVGRFALQRQDPGESNWSDLARIAPTAPRQFVDRTAPRSGSRYRLQAELRTGEVILLGETTTRGAIHTPPRLRLLANPVRGALPLSIADAEDATVQLELFDAAGRRHRTHELAGAATSSRFDLQLTGLPAGVYFLRAVSAAGSDVARVVVLP